jgi:hypothetical protein
VSKSQQQNQNHSSPPRQSRSQTAMAKNSKLENLYSIIDEFKAQKKEARAERRASQRNQKEKMLVSMYHEKIIE